MHFDAPQYNVRLVNVHEKHARAKIHANPSNNLIAKIEDIATMPEPFVMTMFQGD